MIGKIGVDPYNVILYRRAKTKSGKEQWETFGYYSTLGNALVRLIRQGIRDAEFKDIRSTQNKIEQLEHDIFRMVEGNDD
jgi:hypothetical protein